MPAPNFSPDDFAAAAKALMPRGLVWPTDPDSLQSKVLTGLAGVLALNSDAAGDLLFDAFPDNAVELLPEWEASLGLPDPCAGPGVTVQQRQAQVIARLTNTGGASVAYYEAYAAALGFTVTVQRFTPFRSGQCTAGMQCGGSAWAFTYAIVAPTTTEIPFRAGQSTAGEPLNAFGNAVLECELAAIRPAHAYVLFRYH